MSNKVGFGRDAKEFLAKLERGGDTRPLDETGVRITSISASGGEKVTVGVLVSNPSGREEAEFVLMNDHAEELGLAVGMIDEELLPEIDYYAEVARAYSSACSSFAFSPSSLRSLSKKLIQKGFERDVVADAIEVFRGKGVINESELAIRRAQLLCEKLWGKGRILMKLREDGFEDGVISVAIASLDEVDFASNCAELIRKRFGAIPQNRQELDKMYASLSRMGFSSSDIKAAISLFK